MECAAEGHDASGRSTARLPTGRRLRADRLGPRGALVVRANNERIRIKLWADGQVNQLLVADIAELPRVVASVELMPSLVTPRLEAVANAPNLPRDARLRATYVLAARPGVAASRLIEFAPSSDLRELAAIRNRLAPYAPARGSSSGPRRIEGRGPRPRGSGSGRCSRSPTSTAIGGATSHSPSRMHCSAETLDLDAWLNLLRPAADELKPHPPRAVLGRDRDARRARERGLRARPLRGYRPVHRSAAEGRSPTIHDDVPGRDGHGEAIVEAARKALVRGDGMPAGNDASVHHRRARNSAITLLRLGRPEDVLGLLSISGDPTVRTILILEMHDFGIPPEQVLDVLNRWSDPTARQALLLALESYRARELSPATSRSLSDMLAKLIRDGHHQADRGAAEWLLRRWGHDALLDEWSRDLRREAPPGRAPPGPRLVDHTPWPHDDGGPRPGGQRPPPHRARAHMR